MKKILSLLFLLLPLAISAQTAKIQGKVVDAATGAAVDYADVVVTNMNDKVVASGLVGNGTFLIEKVPVQEVLVMVRMIGYDPYISEKLTLRGGQTVDLGTIRLNQLAVGLKEVTVTGEKNQIVYKLDRQSISGSSSVTASGGTAVDVLATTPSVQVNSEGGMTFRGSSNFLVYVDGQLSPLSGTDALRAIPASSIKDVEIITTPSARYKTDGDVGIINITTKRALTAGWSGLLNLSGSTHGTWNVDAILNYRAGHHNFYVGTNLQDVASRSNFTQEKITLVDGITTRSLADGLRWRDSYTRVAKAGWQFVKDNHNLSLDFQYGQTSNWKGGDMNYDETRTSVGYGTSNEISHNVYDAHDKYDLLKNLFQAALTYTWKINDKNQFDVTSRFRYDWGALEYTESNMFVKNYRFEGTRGYEAEHHWDCDGSLAYKHSFSQNGKLELGYQYTTYSEHGDYHIKYWDRDKQEFEWQDDMYTPFYYRRQTHSVYGMLSDQIGKFSYDAGVRADHVIDKVDIEVKDASRDYNYTRLFPSAHLSYDMGNAGTLALGYSYRTNRPGIWNLEPYITYEDYYTKKTCNPDIRPEYIHSIELSWRKSLGDGNSLAVTGYYRDRRDITDWVRRPYEPGVTLDSIVNAGNQAEKGIEMSLVTRPARWWNSTLNGSVFQYDFTAKCPVCTDRDGIYYTINWLNTFSVAKETKVQLDTHVVGPKILTQGREKSYVYWDLAARQNLAKGKITISVVAHDVFHTARYYNIREAAGLKSITNVKPRYPNIVASISYNFNASSHKSSAVNTQLFEGRDF